MKACNREISEIGHGALSSRLAEYVDGEVVRPNGMPWPTQRIVSIQLRAGFGSALKMLHPQSPCMTRALRDV